MDFFNPFTVTMFIALWVFIHDHLKLRFGHDWYYSNPYDRRCNICGRHEVSHCWSMKTWTKSWWEIFDDGDSSKHKSSKT